MHKHAQAFVLRLLENPQILHCTNLAICRNSFHSDLQHNEVQFRRLFWAAFFRCLVFACDVFSSVVVKSPRRHVRSSASRRFCLVPPQIMADQFEVRSRFNSRATLGQVFELVEDHGRVSGRHASSKR
jgi:hypothetical protein